MKEADPNNATITPKLSQIFFDDGSLRPFQLRKYQPSLDRLMAAGLSTEHRVLDVGVGYGSFLSLLDRKGFTQAFGMDPFPESIEMARKMCQAEIRDGRIEDEDWPYEEDSFDAVTCFDVVEHLERPLTFFEHAAKYVKPGGWVLATTPLKELGYRLRPLPVIGRTDTNTTHINVHPPGWWLEQVERSPLELVEGWRGENVTHVRGVHYFGKLATRLGVAPRKVPVLRSFLQSFCMLMRRPA